MDLQMDTNAIHSSLMKGMRDWKRAHDEFINCVNFWVSLGNSSFKDTVTLQKPTQLQDPVLGSVLTKEFHIHVSPIMKVNSVYAEIVVEVLHSNSKSGMEVARFLINRDGRFFSTSEDQLLSDETDDPSFVMLSNIVQKVLQTPAPTNKPI